MHIRQYATMYPPICDLLAGFIHDVAVPFSATPDLCGDYLSDFERDTPGH